VFAVLLLSVLPVIVADAFSLQIAPPASPPAVLDVNELP